jgi:hypothetical protein
MPVTVPTGRGLYRLTVGDLAVSGEGTIAFAATLARSDGIERVTFRCKIDRPLAETLKVETVEPIEERLAKWLAREFESTRESALKSIRVEHQPLEVVFDKNHPGPFA